MRISNYINYLQHSEKQLANTFIAVAKLHVLEPDVREMCRLFAAWSLDHAENLTTMLRRYGDVEENEPDRLNCSLLKMRTGSLGLLRDLDDLWLMTNEVKLGWVILQQCSKALRDEKLKLSCVQLSAQTRRQAEWLMMKIKHSAPQVLTVPI